MDESVPLARLEGVCPGQVYRLFPDPEASLLAGILLGVDQGLPEGVETAFQKTGTSHIIFALART